MVAKIVELTALVCTKQRLLVVLETLINGEDTDFAQRELVAIIRNIHERENVLVENL